MAREIKFSDISTVLDEIEYPIGRSTASEELSDVRLILADGDTNLGKLVSETSLESFESAADIESALHNVLPRKAVGEPYQSEGDA
ncbi:MULTISPECIES: hypothetical protein [Haloferax]|uniref:DUF2795 domain-containing protein n=1 Tax=Haloferax marinum TaxID=2666143 RepID=A0A6A8G7V4_9EURY|nr:MULTISPECIES: hypothetical protein [Haloferax]KAB1197883.1 hypothetical protein Hfx1150_10275 [Haloferax sp. CBA1150]MRW96947.1 hypothetical protein [Haloferax marinum]